MKIYEYIYNKKLLRGYTNITQNILLDKKNIIISRNKGIKNYKRSIKMKDINNPKSVKT